MSDLSEREEVIPPRPEGGSLYDSSGKSPEQIESDITDTRAQLGEILDALERKLAPRHLLERGVDMLKDGMSGDGFEIGETLRGHPLPLALIGIGIGWMVISATTGRGSGQLRQRVSGAVQSAAGKAGQLAGQVREKVSGLGAGAQASPPPGPYPTESAGYAYARQKSGSAMAQARESAGAASSAARDTLRRAQDAGSTAWQRAGDYAGQAGDRLQGARDRVTELVEDHPFAVGALGFLAGSLIALTLPRSEMEERVVGPAGAQIRDRAAEIGREAADRAQKVAERTVDAAVGAVKDAASEVGDAAAGKAEEGKPGHESGTEATGGSSPTGVSPG